MRYSKSLFIAASLLIANTVFAADVPKTRQYAQFVGANVPPSPVRFATKGTMADLAREILKQVKVPTGAEITMIDLGMGGEYTRGGGPRPVTEDATYNVDFYPYQPRYIVVYLQMPSLDDMLPLESIAKETSPQWFQAKSKTNYFEDKYNKAVSSDRGDNTQAYVGFKNTPAYAYINDIVNQMNGKRQPFMVVEDLLKRVSDGNNNDFKPLMELVKPGIVHGIISLQIKNGNGVVDEYKKIPNLVDPLVKKVPMNHGDSIDMTIYRFLDQLISGFDDISITKNSLIYLLLDQFDKSLTEIIKQ